MKKKAATIQNEGRFVHAIFCDDIRREIGNKVSFMGCYQGELVVPNIPATLPKLCVHATIVATTERAVKSLTVRLDQNEKPLAVIEVPADDFARSPPSAQADAKRWSATVGVMLMPFNITEPCELRLVVVTEEGEMPGPRLRINVMPQADAAEPHDVVLAPMKAKRTGPAKKIAANTATAKKLK